MTVIKLEKRNLGVKDLSICGSENDSHSLTLAGNQNNIAVLVKIMGVQNHQMTPIKSYLWKVWQEKDNTY